MLENDNIKWKILFFYFIFFLCIKVHRDPDSAIYLRIVIVADTVFLLFLDAFSKVPDTYVEQTAFGAAGKKIHVLTEWHQCYNIIIIICRFNQWSGPPRSVIYVYRQRG